MCYYFNVQFQGQRVNHSRPFSLSSNQSGGVTLETEFIVVVDENLIRVGGGSSCDPMAATKFWYRNDDTPHNTLVIAGRQKNQKSFVG